MLTRISFLCVALLSASTLNAQTTQGTYFADTFEALKGELTLTGAQTSQIKPMVEQETGELAEIACNPVTPHTYKIKAIENIMRDSNKKIKTVLNAAQYEKLLQFRETQMQQARSSRFTDTNPPNFCSTSRHY